MSVGHDWISIFLLKRPLAEAASLGGKLATFQGVSRLANEAQASFCVQCPDCSTALFPRLPAASLRKYFRSGHRHDAQEGRLYTRCRFLSALWKCIPRSRRSTVCPLLRRRCVLGVFPYPLCSGTHGAPFLPLFAHALSALCPVALAGSRSPRV